MDKREIKLVNVGEPTEAPLPLEPSENKDYEEIIKLYDDSMERAVARELFKLDQDQLRALLYEAIEHDELVEWYKLWSKGKLSETDLEELISEDKEWIVEEIILHTFTSKLAEELRVRPQRRYLTVEVFGYDLNNTYDLVVKAKHSEGTEEDLYADVIEMTDEDGRTL